MYIGPDYSRAEYGHNADTLKSIRALLALPLWARRRHMRQWETHIQPFIYRYLDFNPKDQLSMKKARDLLVRSHLYLPAPSDFNDPYDFRAVISLTDDPVERRNYFRQAARRVLREHPELAAHISGTNRKIEWLTTRAMKKSIEHPTAHSDSFERNRDQNGVACFCLDPRNLLMWSLYSAGHTGICIQFDVTRDPGALAVVHPVTYHDQMARLTWPADRHRIVDDVILRKGKIWQHEQEVRYVSLTTVRDSILFNGTAVTGIILGSRFSADEALQSMLVERLSAGGLQPPKIFRAVQKPDTYGLVIQRLRGAAPYGAPSLQKA